MEPRALIEKAELRCQDAFRRMEEIEYHNTEKVLDVMRRHAVSPRHFAPTTGYGYDDVGRDTLEAIYADLFHTEAAIVRPQIVSGTHTLALAMFGVLRPGDELLYASGAPYDSLEEVIGLRGDGACSLKEMNVSYAQVEMKDGKLDLPAIRAAMKPNTRMVAVQRSRGYSTRPSLMPEDVEPLARMLHEEFPNACLPAPGFSTSSDAGADLPSRSVLCTAPGDCPTGCFFHPAQIESPAPVRRIGVSMGQDSSNGRPASGRCHPSYGIYDEPHSARRDAQTAPRRRAGAAA